MSHSIFFENLFSDWLASQQSGDTANQRNDFQKMECDTFYLAMILQKTLEVLGVMTLLALNCAREFPRNVEF